MLASKVAKRYAQGLLDFTNESGQTSMVYGEMKDVAKIMNESKELVRFFQVPFIDYKKKAVVAKEIFKNCSASTQNLIQLVIKHGRETHLKDIAQTFVSKVDALNGIQKITLTTVAPLSETTLNDILKSTTLVNPNAKYDLKQNIDQNIIGGYILRVGDQQIDASVRSKLNQIEKDFQLN